KVLDRRGTHPSFTLIVVAAAGLCFAVSAAPGPADSAPADSVVIHTVSRGRELQLRGDDALCPAVLVGVWRGGSGAEDLGFPLRGLRAADGASDWPHFPVAHCHGVLDPHRPHPSGRDGQ